MAGFDTDSDTDYGYDLTTSDEEELLAIVDRLSSSAPQPRSDPLTPSARASQKFSARNPAQSSVHLTTSTNSVPDADASFAIEEAIAAISDDDLSVDTSDLDGRNPDHVDDITRSSAAKGQDRRRLAPSVSPDRDELASFVHKTKPRSAPTLLSGPEIRYPDLSRALSEADKASESLEKAKGRAKDLVEDNRPPILRFRTFPMKPFSVSDLIAGSWCELQYYYTLTQLPGGRKTRTAAMKRGSEVHEKLEREVYTPVQIDVTKKEDAFGLKIWNTIQGLRVLRDTGLTRELEVWGMVDGNVVNGVIDGLSYENPDPELEEEVLSSRGSSQTVTNSQMTDPGTNYNKGRDYEIYITDVKTRTTAAPPSQAQVRVAIIQLFLYHRFLTQMATDQLDYLRVFERYGLNPDEPFSDSFMAQIGAIHGEIFADIDAETSSASSFSGASSELSNGLENGGFVSAPSSPSQLSSFDLTEDGESSSPSRSRKLKYRTLRALLPLLRFEIHLTFPRGAADLGQIVAVEYRYRSREDRTTTTTSAESETSPEEADASSSGKRPRRSAPGNGTGPVQPEDGSVICTNTFFVEPHTLDLYLEETMRWWKGEREPHGVPLEEAFKCRSCEFVEGCEWRRKLDMEAIRKAKVKKMMRADKGKMVELDGDVVEEGGKSGSGSGKGRGGKRKSAMAAW